MAAEHLGAAIATAHRVTDLGEGARPWERDVAGRRTQGHRLHAGVVRCRDPVVERHAGTGSTVARTASSAILPAVEQRTGPTTPPIHAAGTDPGYVPGLTAPRPAEAEEAASEEVAERAPDDADREEGPEAEFDAERPDSEEGVLGEDSRDDEEAEDEGDGPVFEVSDRRSSITAGRAGIRFQLDGETAEFPWEEIGAVEVDTARFGRRFALTVYTTALRWYSADVEAPARSLLKVWTVELDAALDAYFEDSRP